MRRARAVLDVALCLALLVPGFLVWLVLLAWERVRPTRPRIRDARGHWSAHP